MSSPGETLTSDDRRAAIERELQERLRARSAAGRHLQCVGCGKLNAIDAHFCIHCGAKFNAVVVTGGRGAAGPRD